MMLRSRATGWRFWRYQVHLDAVSARPERQLRIDRAAFFGHLLADVGPFGL
jgi:hypothetical protein